MKPKKYERIARIKIPNLVLTGEKSYRDNQERPKFFSKIDNSFKLLEESFGFQLKEKKQTSEGFNLKKKNFMSERLKRLSYPRTQSESMHKNINSTKPMPHFRIRHSQHRSFYNQARQEFNPNAQITGSNLVSTTVQEILAMKEQKELIKQQDHETLSESDEEPSKVQEPIVGIKRDRENVEEWAANIIGGESGLYDQYDRKMMEKIKIYQSRQFRIAHQNLWK